MGQIPDRLITPPDNDTPQYDYYQCRQCNKLFRWLENEKKMEDITDDKEAIEEYQDDICRRVLPCICNEHKP